MPPNATRLIADWDKGATRYDAMTARLEERFLAPSRRWIAARATGEVLEVAIGTGANLAYYSSDVRLTALDWSAGMLDVARAKAQASGREIAWHHRATQRVKGPTTTVLATPLR